jgi:hypothetical protein
VLCWQVQDSRVLSACMLSLWVQNSCVLSAVAGLSALGPLLCQHKLGRMVQHLLLLVLAAPAALLTN